MAFDTLSFETASNDATHHKNLDICACAMCANGSEDEWGVDGIYNVAYESQSAADIDAILAATGKPIFTWDEAGAQISRWNVKWDDDGTVAGNAFGTPGEITYGFLQGSDLSTDTSTRDYREMTAIEIAFTLVAINEFEEIANLTFVRVNGTGGSEYLDSQNDADMDFQAIDSYNGGWMSGSIDNAVRISNGTSGLADYGSWAYKTAMHEIGHGVGLPHPGDYNGSGATTYENQAVYAQDTYMYTVMSYWSHTITGGDTFETVYDDQGNSAFIGGYATGLLLHDIAALHRLYGANMTTRDGDTTYGFNSTEASYSHWNLDNWDDFFVASIWDAGGVDTIDASGYYEDQVISLVEESFSSLGGLTYNLSIARGAVIENAIGGAGDDVFVGNAANNTINGGAGLDIIDYSALTSGITFLLAVETFEISGQGTDTLISIEGVIGTNFDDLLVGDANDNYFEMGDGNDSIIGGDGFDIISLRGATVGVKVTATFLNEGPLGGSFTGGSFTIAGLGTNSFTSLEGVRGTEFRDVFRGDAGLQYYDGGGGDDVFVVSSGGDTYIGGAGSDTLDFRGSATRISLTLYTNTLSDGGDYGAFTFEDFENVFATNGNDFINASAADNTIITYDGNDTIYAQQGNDFVKAGSGNDYIGGWYGDDRIYGDDGDDVIEGQFGNDDLRGGNGVDTIRGGDGDDIIKGENGDDLIYGDAGNDLLLGGDGADTIEGGSGNDIIRSNDGDDNVSGGDGADNIRGGNDNDTLSGNVGDDRLYGERGDDVLDGGSGDDRLYGGDGNDTLTGGDGADRMFGDQGDDFRYGGTGNDILRTSDGADTLYGGDGSDALFAGDGNDELHGDEGNDKLYGGNGIDELFGGDGRDYLYGGNDDDVLIGGTGRDFLTGGSGIDTFVFEAGDSSATARDAIQDYEAGEIIEIAGHTFVGESAFSAGGGFEVRYSSTSGGQTFLELDRDGDGNVDERIDLRGTTEWDFASDGTNITGVVASPGEGDLI